MTVGVEVLLAAVLVVGLGAGAIATLNRPSHDDIHGRGRGRGGGRGGSRRPMSRRRGVPRQSLLVKTWNASGAPRVDETRLPDAAAVLTGRAAGAAGRTGRHLSARAGRALAAGSARAGRATAAVSGHRWDTRTGTVAAVTPLVWRSHRPTEDNPDSPGGAAGTDAASPDTTAQRAGCGDCGETDPQRVQPTTSGVLCDRCLGARARARGDDNDHGSDDAGRGGPGRSHHGDTGGVIPMATPHPAAAGGHTQPGPAGVSAPGDWQQVISGVADYEPESDQDLIEWMRRQTAGVCGYADALAQVFDNCVNGVGLDPHAVQGLSEYASAASDLAEAMTRAHRQFLAVYSEVMEAANRGVVLPYRGRWFTGEAS